SAGCDTAGRESRAAHTTQVTASTTAASHHAHRPRCKRGALLCIELHVGPHPRDDAAPVAIHVVVVVLAVVAEHHRVIGPLRPAALIGGGAERQVVAEPVARIAVRAARAAGDAAA